MRMSFGLEQKMVQKQVLAPRMIQSMEILQLPVLALQEKIEQEMNENPMLEVQEQEASETDEAPRDEYESRSESEEEFVVEDGKDNADDFERLLEMDQPSPDTFDERPQRSSGQMEEDAERRMDALANVQSRPETLQDHLDHQLYELTIEPMVREWA